MGQEPALIEHAIVLARSEPPSILHPVTMIQRSAAQRTSLGWHAWLVRPHYRRAPFCNHATGQPLSEPRESSSKAGHKSAVSTLVRWVEKNKKRSLSRYREQFWFSAADSVCGCVVLFKNLRYPSTVLRQLGDPTIMDGDSSSSGAFSIWEAPPRCKPVGGFSCHRCVADELFYSFHTCAGIYSSTTRKLL